MVEIDKNGYLRTREGRVMGIIVLLSFIGGLVSILDFTLYANFLSFAHWATFIVTGTLVLLKIFGVFDALVTRMPILLKVELLYILVEIVLFAIASILSFIVPGVSTIVGYFVLVAFVVEAFFRYRIYRAGGSEGPTNPAETVEQGQAEEPAAPKY